MDAQPHLLLRDSQHLTTNYLGESLAMHAFRAGRPQPLTLASADFDEDGVPDAVSGFAVSGGAGAIAIHRGNVDALWPYGNAARRGEPPAFLPDARVFALPEAPDFLGAGDFDADGHFDLVAARRGGSAVYFLRGDGHGGFSPAERIDLPGATTAMVTGEINRVDGLADIAVAVMSSHGAQVLVFESPGGALRGEPELFSVPAPAASLAMLPLDEDSFVDLAVGAGSDLLIVHGRDRMLSHARATRQSVPAAKITRQSLPFAVRSLAAGHFTSSAHHILDLAALGDDGKIHFFERSDADYQAALADAPLAIAGSGGMAAPIPAGSANGRPAVPRTPFSDRLVLRDEVSMSSYPESAARLVTAHISLAGADDLILPDSPGGRLHVISRVPGRRAMHLVASLESHAPIAALTMRLSPSALHGLVVLQAGQTEPSVLLPDEVHTFTVTNTQDVGSGPLVPGSLADAISQAAQAGGASTIRFNIPTTDPNYNPETGTFTITPLPSNSPCGTLIPCQGLPFLPEGCTLDGYTQPGASPNTLVHGDNAVLKIVINGAKAGQGQSGIEFFLSRYATVRGLVVNGFNSVMASTSGGRSFSVGGFGILIQSENDVVEGNFLGTDASGAVAIPNYVGTGGWGSPAVVGGTTPQARNLISGNAYTNFGSGTVSAPNSYLVQGNYIGTDRGGAVSVGGGGVADSGSGALFGGSTAGAGNLISGNSSFGMGFIFDADNPTRPNSHVVQGNLIGTDATGTVSLPNGGGIQMHAADQNLIGGTSPAARNVIAGNNWDGFWLEDVSTQNTIQGNYIGVDITGASALPNEGHGINHSVINGMMEAVGTLIGGETAGAGNVISGNLFHGISLGGGAGSQMYYRGATVLGNLIGADATGAHAVPNGFAGISISQGGSFYTIGGTDTPAGNVIAFNTTQGVVVNTEEGNSSGYASGPNAIVGNTVFSNGGAGVWIRSGAGAQVSQNSIYANGGLGIDIDAAGHQVGSSCQASVNGANGLQNAPSLTPAAGGSALISATATDPSGNTSEFSNCASVAKSGNILNITGSLNSLPNTAYALEFFTNTACDASGYGQGKTFLHRISVTTGSNCLASFGDNIDVTMADLSVSLAVTGGYTQWSAAPTYVLTYPAVVTNNGAAAAANVTLTDTLPNSLAFVSASTTQGSCDGAGGVVTCSLGILPGGATAHIAIVAKVTGVGAITNAVSVTSSTPDPAPSNNTASANINSSYLVGVIDHVSPTSTIAGSGTAPVAIYMYNLYPGVTTVTANGTTLPYTIIGDQTCGPAGEPETCTEISITIPASMTASPNVVTLATVNPAPGGGSYSLNFVVYPSAGTVTQFQITGTPTPPLQNTPYSMTVTALNSNGGVVTAYRGTVNITTANLGAPTFNPPSPYQFTAADAGTHTFAVNFPNAYTGSITVADAGSPNVTGVLSLTVQAVLGPPAILNQNSTPGSVPIGFPFTAPLTLQVLDASRNPLPGITVSFSAPTSGASCIFSNGQSSIDVLTDSNGNASANIVANMTAGWYQVYGKVGAMSVWWVPTNSSHVPAHISAYLGNSQTTPINTTFPNYMAVLVTDSQNNGIGGIPVTFSSPASGASANLPVTTVLTSSSAQGFIVVGEATMGDSAMANGIPGSYQVTATAGGLSTTFSLTNIPGQQAVSYLGYSGGSQSTPVYTQFANPVFVRAYDANNARLAQIPITFSAPSSGPSAAFSPNPVLTDGTTGKATVTVTANGVKGGPYNVTATAPNGVSVTFKLTNTAGSTNSLTATAGTPQTTIINTPFAALLQVTLLDPNGAPLSGQVVSFSAPTSGPSATLSAPGTVTNASGIAEILATANGAAGTYSVTANFGALAATFTLTNALPTPASLTASGGTPQSAVAGSAFAIPLQVTVKDSNGNPVAQTSVTFTAPASGAGATLSAATAATNAQGIASVTATANHALGKYSVTASVGSLTTSFLLANTVGPPASLTATGGALQATLVGSSFAAPLEATVRDINGNLLDGVAVTFSAPTAGASAALSAISTLSGSNGVASVTATANAHPGSYNVTALVNGLAGTATFSLTNAPFSPCDVNQDTFIDTLDVRRVVSEALEIASPPHDLNRDNQVSVLEAQIVINAILTHTCSAM